MIIKEFIALAKDCKTKAELSSLAQSNGLILRGEDLNQLFQKITDGEELSDDSLESAAGGLAYGITPEQLKNFIYKNK